MSISDRAPKKPKWCERPKGNIKWLQTETQKEHWYTISVGEMIYLAHIVANNLTDCEATERYTSSKIRIGHPAPKYLFKDGNMKLSHH